MSFSYQKKPSFGRTPTKYLSSQIIFYSQCLTKRGLGWGWLVPAKPCFGMTMTSIWRAVLAWYRSYEVGGQGIGKLHLKFKCLGDRTLKIAGVSDRDSFHWFWLKLPNRSDHRTWPVVLFRASEKCTWIFLPKPSPYSDKWFAPDSPVAKGGILGEPCKSFFDNAPELIGWSPWIFQVMPRWHHWAIFFYSPICNM